MCSGNFVKSEKLPVTLTATSSSGPGEQVALGSDTGALFIFHNFSVSINGLFLKSVDVIYMYWEILYFYMIIFQCMNFYKCVHADNNFN